MKNATKRQKITSEGAYAQPMGIKAKRMQKKVPTSDEGHIVKYSASAYKSQKGQGDTLKAGKYEPFAYIQLNPKMLNKRNKTKAIKSFEGVVSHGKKINKRSKDDGGLLSGISFKK